MTTYTNFAPPPNSSFTFQPTLDGDVYQAVISWGLFGQRWYLNLYAPTGERVLTTAVAGSPPGLATASLIWDGASRRVTITTASPHKQPLGQVANVFVRGVAPDSYNGGHLVYVTGPTTMTYEWATDPDPSSPDAGSPATVQGVVLRDVDLIAGYFSTSRLVYRAGTNQFEVDP